MKKVAQQLSHRDVLLLIRLKQSLHSSDIAHRLYRDESSLAMKANVQALHDDLVRRMFPERYLRMVPKTESQTVTIHSEVDLDRFLATMI